MSEKQLIFVGFELTDEVRAELEKCPDKDRIYLDNPAYLETVEIEGHRYLGKRIASGAAIDRIEDTARSVVSLLSRVSKNRKVSAFDVLLLAAEEEQPVPEPEKVEEPKGGDNFNYSNLV